MSPRALGVTDSDAENLDSFFAFTYTLLLALTCCIFSIFIPYAIMTSVLSEGYRSVMIQTNKSGKRFEDISIDFVFCCCTTKSRKN